MLAEGAKHVLGWNRPTTSMPTPSIRNPRLLRNYKLGRHCVPFLEPQLGRMAADGGQIRQMALFGRNAGRGHQLFMDYETFGEHQTADTGIFEFMRALPKAILAKKNDMEFATVSEAAKKYQPVSVLHCPHVCRGPTRSAT